MVLSTLDSTFLRAGPFYFWTVVVNDWWLIALQWKSSPPFNHALKLGQMEESLNGQ